jgi:general secretion pathway protein G
VGDSGYPKKLEDLVEGVIDQANPAKGRIYFMRRIPHDPFATDPNRSAAENWGKRSYASPPDAPGEGADVFDIYSLAPGTGINGRPYREW